MYTDRVVRRDFSGEGMSADELEKLISGKAIIKAEEMKAIVEDWTLRGFGDLTVNESFLERLTEYTNFRKNLAEALDKMLYQEIERYIADEDVYTIEYCGTFDIITSDNNFLVTADMYAYCREGDVDITEPKFAAIMDFDEFRLLLAALGNKMISYMRLREDDRVDVRLYLKERGMDLRPKSSKSETKVLQLILPEDKEKKNDKSGVIDVQ